MQAITTKYLGPTNTLGSRVKVDCWLKSKTMSWECSLSTQANHERAIEHMVAVLNLERAEKNNAAGEWHIVAIGSNPNGYGYTAIIDLKF